MATEQEKDQHIAELTMRIEKLQSQKDFLLKELDGTEEKYQAMIDMYARYFPPILDAIKDPNPAFTDALHALSKILKKKNGTNAEIEPLLNQVQTAMLKEAPKNQKGKASTLSGFFRKKESQVADPDGDTHLQTIKSTYVNLTHAMKESLDAGYGAKLNELVTRFQKAKTFDNISLLQKELFSLIQQYIYNIGSDREKIAIFVKDIVKRILQIEAGMNHSFTHTHETVHSNRMFGDLLSREIDGLKSNINVSEKLDDLKNHVSQTLSTIETALKEKTEKDNAIKLVSEKKKSEFQTGFSKLKKELDQAIKHSKDLETKLNQDPLTKIYNRRAYHKRIQSEMDRLLRYQTIFSILVLDIDFFKKVNDTYGHAIGDKCLQEIARRTGPVLRKNDMLARYGGEEFVIVMPETDATGAATVAEKIRQTIEKIEFIYKEKTIKMTVSIGVSQATPEDKMHEKVFERADAALYRAKNEGRNRVVVQ